MKMEIRSRAIDKVHKRRDRIDMPDFQREEVWPDTKKRLLVDSILRGWHLPKFYFRKLDNGTLECIDGQQRLSAIFEFFDNELVFDEDLKRTYKANRYRELSDDLSDRFDDFEIEIEEIEGATDEELEELFKRLQLGTPLNTAEKINAVMGQMRDFCHEIADRPFFRDKIALRDTRYSHYEIVVKWAFVEARGIQPQMRLLQLESLLKENRTFSKSSDTARKILGAVEFLDRAFPEKCTVLRNRANTLSICMLATRVYEQGLATTEGARVFREFVESFFDLLTQEVEKGARAVDKELIRYQTAISSDSGGGGSIRARINILTKRLATYSPTFSVLIGAYHDVSNEVTRNIAELSQIARDMLYDANRKYSATHGQDLFKMTTESSAALTRLGEPCRDIRQYGELIDSLYFLLYEGSGSCNRLPSPPPNFVMDVKFLRTAIRHDVDHGSESEVAKKRLRAGSVFEQYSGKKVPEECGPEEFLSTHVHLMTEMVRLLQEL